MPALTSLVLFVGQHKGPEVVDDPNLYSADDFAAYLTNSAQVSIVTSGVTSAAASGALNSVPVSTADSKAVSSGTRASVADSKAISASVNTSVADSKSISNSVNISVADSKAVSVAAATIVPTVGGIPGFQQTGAGAVVRVANAKMAESSFSVKDFGAVGDNVTIDTSAIQAAVTALGSSGGTIYFPRGTYKVNGVITLGASNTALVFERGATIHATVGASDGAVFYADTKDNIRIEGATMTGAFPAGIFIFRGSGHQIRDNVISGATVSGSLPGVCAGIYVEEVSDTEIDNNRVSGCGTAGIDYGADIQCSNGNAIVTNVRITNNKCSSTQVITNILCYNPLRCKILGNTVTGARVFASTTGSGGYGILVYKTSGISTADIGDSLIAHNNTYTTQGCGINNQSVPRTTISDNDVETPCTAQTEISLSVAGIVSESERGIVANNRVKNSGKAGIIISGLGSYTLVTGNSVYHPAIEGIAVQGAAPTDVTIIGNYIDTCTGQLAIGAWRFVNVAHRRIIVMGNVMRTVGQGVYFSALSDGCIIKDNIETGLSDNSYTSLNLGAVVGGSSLIENNHSLSTTLKSIDFPNGTSPDRGDTSVTLLPGQDYVTQYFRTALTAPRTVTLSSQNARNGTRFRIVREGLGAGTLDVGGLKTIPAATKAFVDVQYTVDPGIGDFWVLVGYGLL